MVTEAYVKARKAVSPKVVPVNVGQALATLRTWPLLQQNTQHPPHLQLACRRRSQEMAQSWDGWVLYTAANGHKYHYNHLTHESRWAVDQRDEDNKAEVCMQG